MIKVYIAAPYTKGDTAVNVKRAIDAAAELIDAGYAPYVPQLTHFVHMAHPHDYGIWLEQDVEWLTACDCLLRLPGESNGASLEVAEAMRRNIPVFYDIKSLKAVMG